MKKLSWSVLLLVGLALGGCADADCKEGCDKLTSCGLRSSGVSCSASCTDAERSCAQCLVDATCEEIRAGACRAACPTLNP
jgi:hypothetical protein